jgi:hypothetical protein
LGVTIWGVINQLHTEVDAETGSRLIDELCSFSIPQVNYVRQTGIARFLFWRQSMIPVTEIGNNVQRRLFARICQSTINDVNWLSVLTGTAKSFTFDSGSLTIAPYSVLIELARYIKYFTRTSNFASSVRQSQLNALQRHISYLIQISMCILRVIMIKIYLKRLIWEDFRINVRYPASSHMKWSIPFIEKLQQSSEKVTMTLLLQTDCFLSSIHFIDSLCSIRHFHHNGSNSLTVTYSKLRENAIIETFSMLNTTPQKCLPSSRISIF